MKPDYMATSFIESMLTHLRHASSPGTMKITGTHQNLKQKFSEYLAGLANLERWWTAECNLLSPMILWHDQRGAPWINRLSDAEKARIYAVTGLPAHGNYGISKAAWALERYGNKDAVWLNISEYRRLSD